MEASCCGRCSKVGHTESQCNPPKEYCPTGRIFKNPTSRGRRKSGSHPAETAGQLAPCPVKSNAIIIYKNMSIDEAGISWCADEQTLCFFLTRGSCLTSHLIKEITYCRPHQYHLLAVQANRLLQLHEKPTPGTPAQPPAASDQNFIQIRPAADPSRSKHHHNIQHRSYQPVELSMPDQHSAPTTPNALELRHYGPTTRHCQHRQQNIRRA
ncbi:hypothetical protein Nepgr_027199 [Nepenthes gracilis]|uniref:Uncharacterized protein n=1 Tax=Nepenthes gracilis TaxID=150966 RepID=A0AAD3TAY6_NEPGR|nr:hypothetical protein Nepgr_027199 [Nepenthes gracilis]